MEDIKKVPRTVRFQESSQEYRGVLKINNKISMRRTEGNTNSSFCFREIEVLRLDKNIFIYFIMCFFYKYLNF